MKKALILAAHPDDETLGCGGIISKYAKVGAIFKVIFLGEGSSCRFGNPQANEARSAIAERTGFASLAMQELGVLDYEFHNLPCGRFDQYPIIEINKLIERSISQFKPDTVFTHSANDANNDHRIVFRSTIMATRPMGSHEVSRLFSYEVPSSSDWNYSECFSPTHYETIGEDDLVKKCNALNFYRTEIKDFPYPRSEKGLRILAQYRGMQAGVNLSEAFRLIREFN